MEVLEPLRSKIALEKDMSKIQFSQNNNKESDFDNDLTNLPILKHINQTECPIFVIFSKGTVRIATTSFFKSLKYQKTVSICDTKTSYKYFAALIENLIYLEKDGPKSKSRLLVFSQKEPFFK
ncbi:hypothetical protein MHBO_005011 [Bonamia ostreae]|uniref:Uncharacterized protein n=1 Tax=Bonamia ostreae TaxID=126728 RepID=A0ABV2AUX8_9EUKA